MENKDVKAFLNRGYYIDKEIRNLKERRAKLWQEINNVVPAYSSDGTQFNPDIRSKEKKFALYEEIVDKLDQRITELRRMDLETQNYIDKLDDSKYRMILTERHVDRKTWRQIQLDMHVSEKTAFRYYDEALEEMGTILELQEFEF